MGTRRDFVDGITDTILEDTMSSTVTYYGKAKPGTEIHEAKWQIMRVQTIDGVTYYEWARGNPMYVHQWNQRLLYFYK